MLLQRLFSSATTTAATVAPVPKIIPPVRKTVVISKSSDIYANLALEHWIYKNVPFAVDNEHHLLMLWTNEPCVVIGRHQNPWTECDPFLVTPTTNNNSFKDQSTIKLARRNSGGGTVYHDLGNLNLTFFTPNEHYNRKYNLEFIAAAIFRDFTQKIDINDRDDLVVGERKISGTAAKVARHAAYHHCTLLVNANLDRLHRALRPTDWEIETTATKSTRAKILNLSAVQPKITVDSLMWSLGSRYLQQNNSSKAPQLNKRPVNLLDSKTITKGSLSMQLVDPCEENFPGLQSIIEEYKSWDWIYGRTPKFTASKLFFRSLSDTVLAADTNSPLVFANGRCFPYRLKTNIENGLVNDLQLQTGEDFPLNDSLFAKLEEARKIFNGKAYSGQIMQQLEDFFRETKILAKKKTYQ